MNKCKDCKYFDNTKPVSTIRGNDKYNKSEEYIGECTKIHRIDTMNDSCTLFEKKEVQNNE